MISREILSSHPVTTLRREIAKTNIKGYSKMKKAEVIDLMMKDGNQDKFHHIKMAEPKERKAPAKKERRKRRAATPQLGDKHEMPDGTVMTGKKHTAKSKDVPLKRVTKEDIAELGRGKKKKHKKKPPYKGKVAPPPLTATKQDGTVVELKRKERKRK